jgi:transposase
VDTRSPEYLPGRRCHLAKTKVYTKEFKENAVRLSMSAGKTVAGVARELGVSLNTLNVWRREFRRTAPPPANESLEEENRRLRRELERTREEAEILKKAIAYFAQPPKK